MWKNIATFTNYEEAKAYVDNIDLQTNDNAIKEFKIKVVHDRFVVKSRYNKEIAGSAEQLNAQIEHLKKVIEQGKQNVKRKKRKDS